MALSRRPPATCYIVATPLDFGGDFLSEKARHLREKEWRQVMGLLPSLQRRPVRFEDPRVILCYIPAPWLRMVREDLREDLLKGFVQRG
ncbi:MAG: hypothetical protein NTV92_05275, partial [Candidatus Bipolaricaulota bacterium]|nr:hypothetical protein [Candidatus Bipolaricaulota bacterium]